jgi:hypothetical protein
MTTGFILTSEVAAAYFDLCLMREAVTEKERVDILKELCAVGKAQAFSTSSTKEEVIESIAGSFNCYKVSNKKVCGEGPNHSNPCRCINGE